jgi:hypothetical protein
VSGQQGPGGQGEVAHGPRLHAASWNPNHVVKGNRARAATQTKNAAEVQPSPQCEQEQQDGFLPMSSMTQTIHINRAEFRVENGFRGMVVKHSEGNALPVTNATSGLKSVQHASTA